MAVGFGYGNQPSPGDGGLGSGAGGSDLGLSSHIPGHFRNILSRGSASGEDYNPFQHQQRMINLQRQHQQQEQQAEDRAAASFVAYETGGGIGLLRTGLDHHHHHQHHQHLHQHHQEKSSVVDHGGSPWGAPPGSNPVRELVVGRGIDVVPLAERLVDVEAGKNPLHLLQIPHEQQQPGQQAPNPSPVAHAQDQQVALQGQQQPADSSASRPHGRGHQPGGTTCKECGNQAKKDCQYQRCRTCCKSRAYDCVTHVKSTWVPAAKRRERQALEAAAVASGQPRPRSKRTRSLALHSVASAAAQAGGVGGMNISGGVGNPGLLALPGSSSPRSSDMPATGSFRGPVLPPEVRAHALFKCVKVTGIEDGENEYAYQATVKIGGHVFKGVLYDQGVEAPPAPIASLADLQLGAARSLPPSSAAYLDPSQIYGSGTLLGALR